LLLVLLLLFLLTTQAAHCSPTSLFAVLQRGNFKTLCDKAGPNVRWAKEHSDKHTHTHTNTHTRTQTQTQTHTHTHTNDKIQPCANPQLVQFYLAEAAMQRPTTTYASWRSTTRDRMHFVCVV